MSAPNAVQKITRYCIALGIKYCGFALFLVSHRPKTARELSSHIAASASSIMVLIPTVKWAQRTNCVYLTIDVQDSKGEARGRGGSRNQG